MSQTPPEAPVEGVAPSFEDTKIREAAADLLVKREERGRDTATALVSQVAVVGTFLGGFSLLSDGAKEAVTRSPFATWALVAAAASLALSMTTYFVGPSTMPALSRTTDIRDFLNRRAIIRRRVLIVALVVLVLAIALAVCAYHEGEKATRPSPSGTVSLTYTPATKDAAASAAVVATWSGLEPGTVLLTCLTMGSVAVAGGTSTAAGDGRASNTLTASPAPTGADTLTAITSRLVGMPRSTTVKPLDSCGSARPASADDSVATTVALSAK